MGSTFLRWRQNHQERIADTTLLNLNDYESVFT
jgi:hypothetical protein